MKQVICIEIKGNQPVSYVTISEETLRKMVDDRKIILKQEILEKMLASKMSQFGQKAREISLF